MTGNSDLPKDPYILLSFINMKLRDQYKSLKMLCGDYAADEEELTNKLKSIGYKYSNEINQFTSV